MTNKISNEQLCIAALGIEIDDLVQEGSLELLDCIAEETYEEIHTALRRIDRRDRAYLWYRFGFEGNMEHPLC